MACRVFIEPTLENYNKKKDEIGLKEELTTEKSKEYKERFPFMNWSSDSSKKLLIKYLKLSYIYYCLCILFNKIKVLIKWYYYNQ